MIGSSNRIPCCVNHCLRFIPRNSGQTYIITRKHDITCHKKISFNRFEATKYKYLENIPCGRHQKREMKLFTSLIACAISIAAVSAAPLEKRDTADLDVSYLKDKHLFYTTLNVGGQDTEVLIDSGASGLILTKESGYNPSKSDSAQDQNKKVDHDFLAGHYSGKLYKDNVQIGDITIKNQGLTYMDKFVDGRGNLGLTNRPVTFGPNTDPTKRVISALIDKKDAAQIQFSFNDKGGSSKLRFGHIKKSDGKGDWAEVPITPFRGQFYVFPGSINNHPYRFQIDTGGRGLMVKTDQAKQIFADLGLETSKSGQFLYGVYDCDKGADITFKIGGKEFKASKDLMKHGELGDNKCLLSLMGSDAWYYGDIAMIGDSFLRQFTIGFDLHEHRVSIAEQK